MVIIKEKWLIVLIIALLFSIFSIPVQARSGCCSWHGGVSRCDTSVGRQVCNDGTYSPSCGCTYIPPKPISTPPAPTKADLIKTEVNNAKTEYYKNTYGFREALITKLINSLGTDINSVAFYVYTMLPDVK